MKIKKLLALGLVGTMVFSMAACGGSKDSDKGADKTGDVTVETVLEAFDKYTDESDTGYSYDMIMSMKIEAEEMSVEMDSKQTIMAYDGVKYTKESTTTSMLGMDDESVTETYLIKMEDGTVIEATKDADDDEWDVYETEIEEDDSESKLNVEELAKTAKIEKDGNNYLVTATVNAEEMGLTEEGMMEGLEDTTVEVVITYNAKQKDITSIDVNMDKEIMEALFSALLGEVEVKELTIKVENIKKSDKAIEIPSEIELD